jgi:hypothetical protein
MKTALVLGGGGFIGGHLAKRLKKEGFWVRIVDIKEKHEYWNHKDICDEYIQGDLRDPLLVSKVIFTPNQKSENDKNSEEWSDDDKYEPKQKKESKKLVGSINPKGGMGDITSKEIPEDEREGRDDMLLDAERVLEGVMEFAVVIVCVIVNTSVAVELRLFSEVAVI